uniref:Uncharacterized protein n=1 Tax=Virgibacillus oceani TaxID=1479511 RepID=A0A917HQJ1_9BACI|nr:hypothetical protein GCM10011398_36700 [Virgibacillus oceani]
MIRFFHLDLVRFLRSVRELVKVNTSIQIENLDSACFVPYYM